jgi:serine protease Do
MNVVKQIKEKGYVTRGQLGVMMQPITDDIAKALKLGSNSGAAVTQVTPGSGADKAGLKPGDIIVGYNGQPITQAADLPPLVGMTAPGSKATVTILRDGKKQDVTVTIGEMKRDGKAASASSSSGGAPLARSGSAALGLSVEDVDSDTRQQLGLKAGEGVLIGDVTGPVAARAGLQPGDVILMVNQQRVGSAAAFREATKGLKPGDTVLLLVRHGDQSGFVGLTIPKDGGDE